RPRRQAVGDRQQLPVSLRPVRRRQGDQPQDARHRPEQGLEPVRHVRAGVGPDGLLYLSVGNHAIDLQGPNGKLSGRGSSGIVARMKPDGSDLERLVHGLRVPYSFEYDPFGQLWVLSNGEGNPNRFVRVVEGVDYHCYSRGAVGNEWLAGR